MNRRELLALAFGSPLMALGGRGVPPKRLTLADAPWRVVTTDGRPATDVRVERTWSGSICRSRVVNRGSQSVRLREIRARGFEPAIWVGPFIAEKDSNLFKQHPDWFVA